MTLWRAFTDLRVMSLAMMYFTIVSATYGITFFLPQIVKGLGGTDVQTGLLTAAPYIVGTIGLLVWSWSSDKTRERKWHYIVACLLGAAGLATAGYYGSTVMALVAVAIATIGLYGCKSPFWTMPSEFLTGTAAAGGIAMINSVGNLGGFRRSVRSWLDQGFNRRLRDRAVFPGRLRSCFGNPCIPDRAFAQASRRRCSTGSDAR